MIDDLKAIKKLLWMNIMFTWWTFGLVWIVLVSVWVDYWIYQAILYLGISLAVILYWQKLDKKVRPLL